MHTFIPNRRNVTRFMLLVAAEANIMAWLDRQGE